MPTELLAKQRGLSAQTAVVQHGDAQTQAQVGFRVRSCELKHACWSLGGSRSLQGNCACGVLLGDSEGQAGLEPPQGPGPSLPSQHHHHSSPLAPYILATETSSRPSHTKLTPALALALFLACKVLPDLYTAGCFSPFKSQLKVPSSEKPSLTTLPTLHFPHPTHSCQSPAARMQETKVGDLVSLFTTQAQL